MSIADIIVVTLCVTVVAALFVAFVKAQHPEETSTHVDDPDTTTSDDLYGKADRPAGPDIGTQDPDMLGGDHRPPEP